LTTSKTLCTLQFDYEHKSLEANFETLKRLLQKTPEHSVVLAPELCLSGYRYESLEESATFSAKILPQLQKLSENKILVLTLIEKNNNQYYNNIKILYNTKILQTRAKSKLFRLGDEEKFFSRGKEEDIKILEIDGIKIAVLLCFELRFTELWQQVLGADIILVPSFWGKTRKEHLKVLSQALAIANQAFVLVANSSDESMASSSGIITPFGDVYRDDSSFLITHNANLNDIKKMRKYINIGLA
jgi:predicted amidohydrolase